MFALGCIVYEVVTAHKLFSGDVAVWEYATRHDPYIPRKWPAYVLGSSWHLLGRLALELVETDPSKRPGATEVSMKLEKIRRRSSYNETSTEGSTGDQVPEVFTPVFTPIYRQGSPGSGIGCYDLKMVTDRVFEFDYLHSGRADHLVLYRPGTGTIWILRNDSGDFSPVYRQGSPGAGIGGYDLKSLEDRVFAFDYEHSGKLDYLVLYRPESGTIWILRNNNGEFTPIYQQGTPGDGIGGYDLRSLDDKIFAFDYEHSGKLDHLVLYRPGSGRIFIIGQHHGQFKPVYQQVSSGIGGYDLKSRSDRAFAFDYSHTGKLDHIVLYRHSAEVLYILRNTDGLFTSIYCQNETSGGVGGSRLGSVPRHVFPYDYEGSGKADHLVLYWPGTGVILILKHCNDCFTPVYGQGEFGHGIGGYDLKSSNDRIFPFAYFPKGSASQLCLYRPGTGTFWILRRF